MSNSKNQLVSAEMLSAIFSPKKGDMQKEASAPVQSNDVSQTAEDLFAAGRAFGAVAADAFMTKLAAGTANGEGGEAESVWIKFVEKQRALQGQGSSSPVIPAHNAEASGAKAGA